MTSDSPMTAPTPSGEAAEPLTAEDVHAIERATEQLVASLGDRNDERAEDGRKILGTVSQLCAALLGGRRGERALRDALTAIANLRPYRDPAYPHISIYELPEIARAALAATPEEK